MAKRKKITIEEIESKKDAFRVKIEESIELKKKGKISPTQQFLHQIKDLIKESIDNKISYKQISKDIYEIYNFKVNEQTIRIFAYNVLNIKKKTKDKYEEVKTLFHPDRANEVFDENAFKTKKMVE